MNWIRRQGSRSGYSAISILILFLACVGAFSAPALSQEGSDKKVILLGFDGVDYRLANQFILEGHLPNLQELKEKGTYQPLDTANPAQSPVAWASVVTGNNPGKTNISGFIRRNFSNDNINPQLATVESSYQNVEHTLPYSTFSQLNQESKLKWVGLFALAFFLVGFLILKAILRTKVLFSLVGGLVVAGAALFFGLSFFDGLPDKVPFPYNLQQGENVWDTLSKNKIRTVGLYAPGAYPAVAESRANILGGLGVPDVNGGTGTWYIYSSEVFTFFDKSKTDTAGVILKLDDDNPEKVIKGKLYGPSNFYQMDRFKEEIKALEKRESNVKLTVQERETAQEDLEVKRGEFSQWKKAEGQTTIEFVVTPDYKNKVMTMQLEGQKQEIKEGEWSDWFKVCFQMTPFLKTNAQVRLRLIKCAEDEIRFFVPAIDISPSSPPGYLRLSSPASYSTDLSDKVGPFETVGWACITHGLKDNEIDESVFMEDIEFTIKNRLKLLRHQMDRKDWDFFFETFYSTDRVQHMMYRLFDENHPQHDPELAKRPIKFCGRDITLKDTVLESYKEMDIIVGEVMDKIKAGQFGKDPTLMVISDHGFAPFYYGVGINNFLIEKGFLVRTTDDSGEPLSLEAIKDNEYLSMLGYVDWEKTKAYSLGLGKIYINLKGREPKGSVDPGEYEVVRDEIIKELMAYKDPNTNENIMKRVFKREDIFSGDFWKEGHADFTFYGPEGEKIKENRYTEGFADLYVGFKPKYRVSWGTSLGGVETSVIVPNEQKWSGDHVSVDPSEVQGVFFCNRKSKITEQNPCLNDIVATVFSIFGVKKPEDMDGQPVLMDF